jgi:CRP/FNR family transcriptional regulator
MHETPFGTVPPSMLALVDEKKGTLNFKKGESIFHADDPAQAFYCISAGQVQLYRASRAKEQAFGVYGPGTWLGYRNALTGSAFDHSARCLTSVKVCKVDRAVLEGFSTRFPSFTKAIVRELASGWTESEKQVYNLGARNVKERLAEYLLSLRKDTLAESHDFDFPLTRETLASLMGTTTESVIRTLSDFRSRGWIDYHDGKISLSNERELEKLVVES